MKKILPLLLFLILIYSPNIEARELRVGDNAPDFSGTDDRGKTVSLSDFRGKMVILYFYPKDDTSGCTVEAKGFRDNFDSFQKKETAILGVSYDGQDSHRQFKEKYRLPFYLITDKDKKISQAYGTAGEFFADRQTFVIDPEGIILKIYRNVNPSRHAEKIFEDLFLSEEEPQGKNQEKSQ